MSARLTNLDFAQDSDFEWVPRWEREELEQEFNLLKENLLSDTLAENSVIALEKRLTHAANEAAGIAWTTEFPLLVFPALFAEFVRRERVRAERQEKIKARSQMLVETV